MHHSAR
jgi:hypothetical protein